MLAVVSLLLSNILIRFVPPSYQAKTTILVMADKPSIDTNPMMSGLANGMNPFEKDALILSQQEIITSSEVFNRFLAKKTAAEKELLNSKLNNKKRTLLYKSKKFIKKLLLGKEYVDAEEQVPEIYLEFRKSIGFTSNLEAGTFEVTYESDTTESALADANYLIEALRDYQLEIDQQNADSVDKFLQDKINETVKLLNDTTNRINDFISAKRFPFNADVVKGRLAQLFEAESMRSQTELALEQVKSEVDSLRLSSHQVDAALKKQLQSGVQHKIDSLVNEISQLEIQLARSAANNTGFQGVLASKLTALQAELNEKLKSIDTLVPTASRKQLLSEMDSKLTVQSIAQKALTDKLEKAKEYSNSLEHEIREFPKLQAELSRSLTEQEILSKIVSLLSEYQIVNSIKRDSKKSQLVSISEPMIIPSLMSLSKFRLMVVLFLFIFSAFTLALVKYHFLKKTILGPEGVKSFYPNEYIGALPHINTSRQPLAIGIRNLPSLSQIRRTIARNREQAGRLESTIIAVTSAKSNNGKTYSSLILGMTLASRTKGESRKVLLIDADLRKEKNTLQFHAAQHLGSKLDSPAICHDTVMLDSYATLDVCRIKLDPVSAGKDDAITNAIQTNLDKFVNDNRKKYDYIIIDTPPLRFDESSDIITISDMIIYCCAEGRSTMDDLNQGMDLIKASRKVNAIPIVMLTNAHLAKAHGLDEYRNYKYAA